MDYRIYSPAKPEGVVLSTETASAWLSLGLLDQVDQHGVVRTPCPCCLKRIVIRQEGAKLDDLDRAYLNPVEVGIQEHTGIDTRSPAERTATEVEAATIDTGPHPGGPFGG